MHLKDSNPCQWMNYAATGWMKCLASWHNFSTIKTKYVHLCILHSGFHALNSKFRILLARVSNLWSNSILLSLHILTHVFVAVQLLGCAYFASPWTVAHQAPLSMGFPKQECWSGLPFPTPGDIPDLQPESPRSPAVAVGFFTTMSPGNQLVIQFSSVQLLSRVLLFATPWTAAHQAFLSSTNFRSL